MAGVLDLLLSVDRNGFDVSDNYFEVEHGLALSRCGVLIIP